MLRKQLPQKSSSLEKAYKFLGGLDKNRDDHYTTARIKEFLNYLNNPQYNYKTIHIAGTSGKGSVAVMLAKILEEAGYKTGLITSPYLVTPLEKIKINSRNITENNLVKLVEKYKAEIKKYKLTYFEAFIALSFIYFADQKVDWAVVETGLGGRLDATNVLKPEVAIITTIDFDHTDMLGKTLKQIASEKAAITKNAKQAITGSKLIKTAKYINTTNYKLKTYNLNLTSFNYKNYRNIKLNLLGEFQIKNAILAINAAKILKIPKKFIYSGLNNVRHAGRFEIISKKPLIIMDGAHNEEKMKAFSSSLKKIILEKNKYKNKYLLLSIKEDKDYKKILDNIIPEFDEIVVTSFWKSIELTKLTEYIKKKYSDKKVSKIINSEKAYQKIEGNLTKSDLFVITGSLYLIGDLKNQLDL